MKIICIGRNYREHAKELDNDIPTEPIFFLKPDSALLRNNQEFYIPDFTQHVDYELELVIKINRLGKHIKPIYAPRYYAEIGLGIDFTARDVQKELQRKGLPWEKAKVFDRSAAISNFIPIKELESPENIEFRLEINGKTIQQGFSKDMIFSVDEIIYHVSKYMTLKIGDYIFTGTPSGVGPVKSGDKLTAWLESQKMMDFWVK